MSTTATWFGDRGLFGCLHLPDSRQARGGVLLCPSLAAEHQWSYRALRELADRLCASGLAVLRFDYYGTGHSNGDLEEEGGTAYFADDVSDALAHLRSTGVVTTVVAGFRLGALIAIEALRGQEPPEAVVLWEPPVSGKRWLRELETVMRMDFAAPEDASPAAAGEIPGMSIRAELRQQVAALALAGFGDSVRHTLVAVKPASEPSLRRALEGGGIDWLAATGTDELLYGFSMPEETMSAIVDWICRQLPAPEVAVAEPPAASRLTIETAGGRVIQERIVQLGGTRLFAVVSEPEPPSHACDSGGGADVAGAGPDNPTVFLNTGVEPCIGPGRKWVHLARRLAADGRRAVRADLSGLGDSPSRPGQPRNEAYAPEALDDVQEVLADVAPGGTEGVTLVGLCSGAYHVLETGASVEVKLVCAVNPVLDVPAPAGTEDRVVLSPRREWLRAVQNRPVASWARRSLPPAGWRLLHMMRVQQSPATGLRAVVDSGARVLVVCGPSDARRFERRGKWILSALSKSGRFDLVTIPHLGHAVLTSAERESIERELLDALHLRRGEVRAPGVA